MDFPMRLLYRLILAAMVSAALWIQVQLTDYDWQDIALFWVYVGVLSIAAKVGA